MFYQRNSISGRLTPSAGVQTPSSLAPAVEGAAVTYQSGVTFPKELPKGPGRNLNLDLLQQMKHYQRATDVPIHLRGGPLDKVLFGATCVLCFVGVVQMFTFIKGMSFPKRND